MVERLREKIHIPVWTFSLIISFVGAMFIYTASISYAQGAMKRQIENDAQRLDKAMIAIDRLNETKVDKDRFGDLVDQVKGLRSDFKDYMMQMDN